jgi:hypothetical protein
MGIERYGERIQVKARVRTYKIIVDTTGENISDYERHKNAFKDSTSNI